MFHHLVITRFAVRANLNRKEGLFGYSLEELFSPERLRFRLFTMGMVTVPSMKAQTEQNFRWIVLTDELLPDAIRVELEALISDLPNAEVMSNRDFCGPSGLMWGDDWLESKMSIDASHVLITNLDNDDGLGRDFVATIQAQVRTDMNNPKVSSLRIYGLRNTLQWDMFGTDNSRFGRVKPWLRTDAWGEAFFVSPGFSLFGPVLQMSVKSKIPHASAHFLNWTPAQFRRKLLWLKIKNFRRHIPVTESRMAEHKIQYQVLKNHDQSHPQRSSGRWVQPIPNEGASPALMLNHNNNAIQGRHLEGNDTYPSVSGPESFGTVAVDWGKVLEFYASLKNL
ncbi:MAG: glycosyltransferase [Flavobacteriales bacterium]